MAKLRYLGHSAFCVEGIKIKAVIDPFLTGNPKSAAKPEDFAELDYIFLTHGHGDHIGNAVEIAKRTGAVVIANTELAGFLSSKKGIKAEGLQIGGRGRFPFGRVKLVPAWHGCPIVSGSEVVYGGIACGFVIEIENKKIYHAGDTGLTIEMQLLAEEDIDIALLPIGGYYTMDIEDATRAVKMIKPRIAVPMHYNTFPKIAADPEEFAELAGGQLTGVKVLAPGDSMDF